MKSGLKRIYTLGQHHHFFKRKKNCSGDFYKLSKLGESKWEWGKKYDLSSILHRLECFRNSVACCLLRIWTAWGERFFLLRFYFFFRSFVERFSLCSWRLLFGGSEGVLQCTYHAHLSYSLQMKSYGERYSRTLLSVFVGVGVIDFGSYPPEVCTARIRYLMYKYVRQFFVWYANPYPTS